MATSAEHPEVAADDGGPDLWELAQRFGWIDERDVVPAMRRTLFREGTEDYRTRLLLHDAAEVLRERGIDVPFTTANPRSADDPDEIGFPSLRRRIVRPTTPEQLIALFRELGNAIHRPAELVVGGSSALILRGLITRPTEDIDVVDELPEPVRADPGLVDRLADKYEVRLAHFGSHYLPNGWSIRASSFGVFGRVTVRLVDAYDVLAGKVFSKRDKDQKDVMVALQQLDLDRLRSRVADSTSSLRKVPGLEEVAAKNWYILTGEETLPSGDVAD